MKLASSMYHCRAGPAAAEKVVVQERIVALCSGFSRYGYRRITRQFQSEAWSSTTRQWPA
jgi:hypothetical protein